MNQKGFANIIIISVVVVLLVGLGGYIALNRSFPKPTLQPQTETPQTTTTSTGDSGKVEVTPSGSVPPQSKESKSAQPSSSNSLAITVTTKGIQTWLSPSPEMLIHEGDQLMIQWTPVAGDFDHYMVNFGNNRVSIFGNPMHPGPVSKFQTSLTIVVDKSIANMFLGNSTGLSEDMVRKNMFIRVEAEKNLSSGKANVIGSGKSGTFSILSSTSGLAHWIPSATRSEIIPISTADGIMLTAEHPGDESAVAVVMLLANKNLCLNFDMKFVEKGDGDWLLITWNDKEIFGFTGTSFFTSAAATSDYYEVPCIALASLAPDTGILKFRLLGIGSIRSTVVIRNTEIRENGRAVLRVGR